MRVGSVKKRGKVRHSWTSTVLHLTLWSIDCGGGPDRRQSEINFNSDNPACPHCVSIHRSNRNRAIRALAKLGVKQ